MDELEISGKRYISSRRAAKENKYHADYIGQLVRSGKILGTKIGRAWYVETNSLAAYLGKDPEPITLKKFDPVLQSNDQISKEREEKKNIPMPEVFSHKIGLTYVSDSPNKEVSDGVPIKIHIVPTKSPTEAKTPLDIRDFSRSFPHRSSRLELFSFLGRVFFGFLSVGVFLVLFGGSYLFSYHVSLIDGVETNTISLGE